MDDEAKKWLKENDVQLDEDGLPLQQATAGPPRPCTRCGTMVECPTPGAAMIGGKTVETVFCSECFKLLLTDSRAFFDGLS